MNSTECIALIEDIITCANAFESKPLDKRNLSKSKTKTPNEIYINAFKELSVYLKHLFVYYDSIVTPKLAGAGDWPWLRYLKRAQASGDYDKIDIITFNYDPWLERLLMQEGIPFEVAPLETAGTTKIRITKPHGSITFCHKTKLEKKYFNINYEKTLVDGTIADFTASFTDLDANYLITPLIPPAGEARRFNQTWAGEIRNHSLAIAKELTADDDMLICGISYWHVDRSELDDILNACSSEINIKMINPCPGRTLIAVITSIFEKFICYTSSNTLKQLLP